MLLGSLGVQSECDKLAYLRAAAISFAWFRKAGQVFPSFVTTLTVGVCKGSCFSSHVTQGACSIFVIAGFLCVKNSFFFYPRTSIPEAVR